VATIDPGVAEAMASVIDRKLTLLTRVMDRLLDDPHLLSGWLSLNRGAYRIRGGELVWIRSPLDVVRDAYAYLDMAYDPKAPAGEVIWQHDHELLETAARFHGELRRVLGLEGESFGELDSILSSEVPRGGYDAETWRRIREAHLGLSAGVEILGLLFMVAEKVRFFDLRVLPGLDLAIPPHLLDPDLQARTKRVLVPPPTTRNDEIVAVLGGMLYQQESPGKPPFLREGQHFEVGQPLYIIEVMKMFNVVRATFAGTVIEVLAQGSEGQVVQKGQPLFKVAPDVAAAVVDPHEIERQRRRRTTEILASVLTSPGATRYEPA
jgi:biotin carboxyl carrier protein